MYYAGWAYFQLIQKVLEVSLRCYQLFIQLNIFCLYTQRIKVINKVFIQKLMLQNKIKQFKQKYSNSSSAVTIKKKTEIPYNQFSKFNCTANNYNNIYAGSQSKSTRLSKVQSSSNIKNKKYSISKLQNAPLQKFQPIVNKKLILTKNIKLQENINNSKTQETQISNEYQDLCKIQLPIRGQDLFKQLTPRDLFFCCQCCQYLFAVEKHLHFPICEEKIQISSLPRQISQKIGKNKLKKILQLSKYVKIKQQQIEELFFQVKQNKMKKIYLINVNSQSKFYKIEQIVQAFVYTYERLLKGSTYQKSTIFGSNLFGCL